jgi:hypothetical protein
VNALKTWLGALAFAVALGGTASVWTTGCSSPPKKAKKSQPRVEKKPAARENKARENKDRAARPRHQPHEHAHPHPHGESDHHHHAHPHPHLPGQNGHHHPY